MRMFEIILEAFDGRKHTFVESGVNEDEAERKAVSKLRKLYEDAASQIKVFNATMLPILFLLFFSFSLQAQSLDTAGVLRVHAPKSVLEPLQGKTVKVWYIQIAISENYPEGFFEGMVAISSMVYSEKEYFNVWFILHPYAYLTEKEAKEAFKKLPDEYKSIGQVRSTMRLI